MPNPHDDLTVAIIEDDRAVREGLSFLIDGTTGFLCVGSFGSVESALRAAMTVPPRVLLLDIHLPGTQGSDAVPSLLERFPGTAILMLSVYADEDLVFQSLCNGASGYLLKQTPPARLLVAIREVATGGSPMSPEIARKVVRLFQRTGPPERLECDLAPQEVRLLKLLAEGHSYQVAADGMHVSINTVRNYIRSIYDKLQVHSKSAAVSKAFKAGIL